MYKIPDLSAVKQAVDTYDKAQEEGKYTHSLGRDVGVAFANATKDINNWENCVELVRPGKKYPANPDDLSWLRKLIRQWEAQEAQ